MNTDKVTNADVTNVGAISCNIKAGNIEECFFDRQEYDEQQGAATARIYVFNVANPAKPTIDAYTYQTFGTPQYLTDQADQFSNLGKSIFLDWKGLL